MITDYHAIYYAHELSRVGGSGVDRIGRLFWSVTRHTLKACAAFKVARPSRSGSLHIGLDNQSLQTSEGENLPHWTCDNAIYHVSFRLADSVPNSRRNEWLAERNSIEENAKALGRELMEEEKKRLQFLYSERIEFFLDAGHGDCHLKKPEIAEIVAGALKHFDGERYHLHAWCVMPNHVHVIVEVAGNKVARPSRSGITPKETDRDGLSTIIHSWKSFTAHEANKRLNRKGDFWQHDAYNHIIRSEKEYRFQLNYVWENPDKAGLDRWQWRWKMPDRDVLAAMPDAIEQIESSTKKVGKHGKV